MSNRRRVAFDLTPATAGTTGVARYVRELAHHLNNRDDLELVPFALGRGPHPVGDDTRRLRVPYRVLRVTWSMSVPLLERLVGPVDVVHVTDRVPGPTRRPLVLTIHDLDAVDQPALHSAEAVAEQHAQLRAARDRADAIIAVSHVTARALVAHGVDAERVTVVHHGVSRLSAVAAGPPLPYPYLLAVGTLDARKGLDVLFTAFRSAGPALGDARLVVVGPDGFRSDAVRAAAEAAADRVILRGPVDDAELASLYRGAVALALPTRAEGFGLPVLEALAAGTPVLASDLPVLREVGADAVTYVPVGDVDAWADALVALISDRDGTGRSAVVAAGRARAALFTWDAAAMATAAVYERVAARDR